MSWQTGIRRSARVKRQELGFSLDAAVHASEFLNALAEATGLRVIVVPHGDSLLCGAFAVLDMDAAMIWSDGSLSAETRAYHAAHEYAHFFIDAGRTEYGAYDLEFDRALADELAPVKDYSPRERREAAANTYAAEMLLPVPLARHLFHVDGLSATSIGTRLGIPTSLVIAQLLEALLVPEIHEPNDGGPQATPPLDPTQKLAAEWSGRPLLVSAGPGTGKTKTLVGRCEYLTKTLGVPARNILALTFSNKAAEEMRERLQMGGMTEDEPWVGTFHSFGLDVLRRCAPRVGLPLEFNLLSKLDAFTLLENNLGELKLDKLDNLYRPALKIPAILNQISRAKDELCGPPEYADMAERMRIRAEEAVRMLAVKQGKMLASEHDAVERQVADAERAEEVARCYAVYQRLLLENGFVDFGDLIYMAVRLLEEHQHVLEELRSQYPHVLADEYQDINAASAKLLALLSGPDARGLWVVGDQRQSIYRFRGASTANVTNFMSDYPNGERLELGVNYRSRQPIVDLFSSAAKSITGEETNWNATRGTEATGTAITFASAEDDAAQGSGIVASIRSFSSIGYAYRDQAILCYTHSQAQGLGGVLNAAGIPTLYLGNVLDREEIKDLIAFVSLCSGGTGFELARVARFPEYAIDPEDVASICALMTEYNARTVASLKPHALEVAVSEPSRRGVLLLQQHIRSLQPSLSDPALLLNRYLFEVGSYLRYVETADDNASAKFQRLLAIHQFIALATSFDRRVVVPGRPPLEAMSAADADEDGVVEERTATTVQHTSTRDFIVHLRRLAAAGEAQLGAVPEGAASWDAVRLMTVHASKGLEFPVVFLPNLVQGRFPSAGRSDGVPEPPELSAVDDKEKEVQYLFFVALSRAKDRIVLSAPSTDSRNGKPLKPAAVLSLIDDVLASSSVERVTWMAPPVGETDDASHPSDQSVPIEPGDKVVHESSALELYMKCPKRYYYQEVAYLRGSTVGTGYLQFHRCLRHCLGWLREQWSAGLNPDRADAINELRARWTTYGPVNSLHERKYWETAVSMLDQALALSKEAEDPEPDITLVAELANCRVVVRPDSLGTRRIDGTLVAARLLTRAKTTIDTDCNMRLALYRRAIADTLPNRAYAVQVRFLSDGSVEDAKASPQHDPGRIAKYEKVAAAIARHDFSASPDSADSCALCPFLLICPHG